MTRTQRFNLTLYAMVLATALLWLAVSELDYQEQHHETEATQIRQD